MKKKRILFSLLTLFAATTMWGEGSITDLTYNSEGNFYEIHNATDLAAMAAYVNAHSDDTGKTFKQTQNITFSHSTEWNNAESTETNYTIEIGGLIGGIEKYFNHTYDGQGYTISGIRSYNCDSHLGIFGRIGPNGTIQNVVLSDTRIASQKYYIGGIVGENAGGTITNCRVGSDVFISSLSNAGYYIGGVVGKNSGGLVSGCTCAATVTLGPGYVESDHHDYGGIAGSNENGTVKDCLYVGSTLGGYKCTGAIVGGNYGANAKVKNCYFTSTTITGWNNSHVQLANADCAVGYNDGGTVTNTGLARTITLGENVWVNPTSSEDFTCGDLIAYTFAGGYALEYGNTLYSTEGATIALRNDKTNYTLVNYKYNDGSDHTIVGNTFTMPAANVSVTATWNPNISTVITGNGTVTVKAGETEVTSAEAGTTLTVILEADEGYIIYGANIDGVSINYSTFNRQTESYWVGTITMPEGPITIRPIFCRPYKSVLARSVTGKYSVNISPIMTQDYVEIGTTVTVTVTPAAGYAIERVWAQVYEAAIYSDMELTSNGDGTYTFTMPDKDVNVYVDYYKQGGDYALNVGTVNGTIGFYNADNDPIKAANENDVVKVRATPANASGEGMMSNGYATILKVTDAGNQPVTVYKVSGGMYGTNDDAFTMPAKAVTVSAEFKNTINVPSSYESPNGSCTVTVGGEARNYADAGETVTCTISPAEGYILTNLYVYYRNMTTYETVMLTCTKVNETTYTFAMPNQSVSVSPVFAFPLANASDNTSSIATLMEEDYPSVVLSGRTLYKDNSWNTLCLPFSVDKGYPPYETTPITGATVMELNTSTSGFNSSTGVLTLNFTEVNRLEAGKPYIIKWESGDDIVNPYFKYVEVTTTTPTTVTSEDGTVSFVGTFSPVDIYSANKENYYLGADNSLYYPWGVTSFNVNSFRAYFHISAGDPTNQESSVKAFVLNFGNGSDVATGIKSMDNGQWTMNNGQWTMDNEAGAWYELSGRRLQSKPTKSGIYIHNGRKVVIK